MNGYIQGSRSLGADPNYLARLTEQVRRLEADAGSAQEKIRRKFEEIAILEDEAEQMLRLSEAFGDDAKNALFKVKDAWEKKQRPRVIRGSLLGFGSGIIASIIAAYAGLVLPGLG